MTVPAVTPSVEVKTWLIVLPLPATAPDTLVELNTVQLKVVPNTPFGLVIATLVLAPEQIVCGEAATLGIGVTTTLTAYGVPLQPAAVG